MVIHNFQTQFSLLVAILKILWFVRQQLHIMQIFSCVCAYARSRVRIRGFSAVAKHLVGDSTVQFVEQKYLLFTWWSFIDEWILIDKLKRKIMCRDTYSTVTNCIDITFVAPNYCRNKIQQTNIKITLALYSKVLTDNIYYYFLFCN